MIQSKQQNYNLEDKFHEQQNQSIESKHGHEHIDLNINNNNNNNNIKKEIIDSQKHQQYLQQDIKSSVDYVDQELLESFAESLSSMDYTTLCIMNHKSREDNNHYNNTNTNTDDNYLKSNNISMDDLNLLSTQDLLDASIDNFPLLFPSKLYIFI